MGDTLLEEEIVDEVTSAEKHRQNLLWIDEAATEVGITCGLPPVLLVHPEIIYLSPEYFKSLLEGFKMLGLEEMLPKKNDQQVAGGMWKFVRSWQVTRPWRGKYGYVNVWYNWETKKFSKNFVFEEPCIKRLSFAATTFMYASVFGIEEAEVKAQVKLNELLSRKQRKEWLFTQSFHETGRSGTVYWLRKNRPTVAFRPDEKTAKDDKLRPLCALCLHPLGWYRESFAGMLVPSDDVIAHLLMIRANEHYFWRKANQHPLNTPNAGIG